MAVIVMPERGIAQQQFEILRFDAVAPERGGRIGGVTLGWPVWQAQWQLSQTLTRDMSDEWRAWISGLRGMQRPFLAVPRDRLYPRTYPNGFAKMTKTSGVSFLGPAATWSQSINADGDALLTLTGLPSGLSLVYGDYIGFKWDAADSDAGTFDRRALVRVVTGANANSSGQSVVTVEPPVNTQVVPSDAVAHLDNPGCFMKLVPQSTTIGPLDRRLSVRGGSIAAVQDLRP